MYYLWYIVKSAFLDFWRYEVMEFWRLIFSSFWVWLGFIILVGEVGSVLVELVKACKRNRKISGYRVGQRWKLDVENASAEDARNALITVTCAPDGEAEQAQEGEGNV